MFLFSPGSLRMESLDTNQIDTSKGRRWTGFLLTRSWPVMGRGAIFNGTHFGMF